MTRIVQLLGIINISLLLVGCAESPYIQTLYARSTFEEVDDPRKVAQKGSEYIKKISKIDLENCLACRGNDAYAAYPKMAYASVMLGRNAEAEKYLNLFASMPTIRCGKEVNGICKVLDSNKIMGADFYYNATAAALYKEKGLYKDCAFNALRAKDEYHLGIFDDKLRFRRTSYNNTNAIAVYCLEQFIRENGPSSNLMQMLIYAKNEQQNSSRIFRSLLTSKEREATGPTSSISWYIYGARLYGEKDIPNKAAWYLKKAKKSYDYYMSNKERIDREDQEFNQRWGAIRSMQAMFAQQSGYTALAVFITQENAKEMEKYWESEAVRNVMQQSKSFSEFVKKSLY